jgi:ArsR family transcriptional regulator
VEACFIVRDIDFDRNTSTWRRMKKIEDPDARLFAAMADPSRLSILRQLASDGTVCACDLAVCCSVGQPTVSHHLKVLREAGLINAERRGTWIHYSIAPAALSRMAILIAGLRVGTAETHQPLGQKAMISSAANNRRAAPAVSS